MEIYIVLKRQPRPGSTRILYSYKQPVLSIPFVQVVALQNTVRTRAGHQSPEHLYAQENNKHSSESSFFISGFAFEQWQKEETRRSVKNQSVR